MHVRRSSERTVQYESRHAGDTMTKQDLRISESLASHKNKKPGVMISKLQKATKREIEVYLTSVSAQILYPKTAERSGWDPGAREHEGRGVAQ